LCADHIDGVEATLGVTSLATVAHHPCIPRPGAEAEKAFSGSMTATPTSVNNSNISKVTKRCATLSSPQKECRVRRSPLPSHRESIMMPSPVTLTPSSPCCRARAVLPDFLSIIKSCISTLLKGGDVYLNKLLVGF